MNWKQVFKEGLRRNSEYATAVNLWRSEHPDNDRTIPSDIELASFLMRKLKRARLALRAATTHAKRTNQRWHKVPVRVISLWEKEML